MGVLLVLVEALVGRVGGGRRAALPLRLRLPRFTRCSVALYQWATTWTPMTSASPLRGWAQGAPVVPPVVLVRALLVVVPSMRGTWLRFRRSAE